MSPHHYWGIDSESKFLDEYSMTSCCWRPDFSFNSSAFASTSFDFWSFCRRRNAARVFSSVSMQFRLFVHSRNSSWSRVKTAVPCPSADMKKPRNLKNDRVSPSKVSRLAVVTHVLCRIFLRFRFPLFRPVRQFPSWLLWKKGNVSFYVSLVKPLCALHCYLADLTCTTMPLSSLILHIYSKWAKKNKMLQRTAKGSAVAAFHKSPISDPTFLSFLAV